MTKFPIKFKVKDFKKAFTPSKKGKKFNVSVDDSKLKTLIGKGKAVKSKTGNTLSGDKKYRSF